MSTTNLADRNPSTGRRVLYCLALLFSFTLVGCANNVVNEFSTLEAESLKYGTVSVGAVRVTDYNSPHLRESREELQKALENIRTECGRGLRPSAVADTSKNPDPNKESPEAVKAQAPWPSETELIGLRMAALKLIESELEDINLDCPTPIEPNFRRVVVSLDCSAWVRDKAGAALVYIDLYPFNADRWCHEAANVLKCYLDEGILSPQEWEKLMKDELADRYKSFDPCSFGPCTFTPPERKDLCEEDPNDLVGFCHRWLGRKKLFPHIVHVERMGAAEYLILAEEDYSGSKFGISGTYPGLPVSAEVGIESHKKGELQTATVRPLSLAFIAGDRRAGWLFMPTKRSEGRMIPTERRLRMVVDVPDNMLKLSIHVHKVFLGPDLGILPEASLAKQMNHLERTRELLTRADALYEKYQEQPSYYRLIKTRMRNLLYQGWAEEISVDIPPRGNQKCTPAR